MNYFHNCRITRNKHVSTMRWVKMCVICEKDKFRSDFDDENNKPLDWCRLCEEETEKKITSLNCRNKRRGFVGSYTAKEWLHKCRLFNWRCCYCGVFPEPIITDHFYPIKLKGTNNIDNVFPCCFTCNTKKGAKHPVIWIRTTFEDNHPMLRFSRVQTD